MLRSDDDRPLRPERCGDPEWRLRWQSELQPIDQELKFWFGMGVTREQDLAPIGGRQVNIDHLDCGKLLERAACGVNRGGGTPGGSPDRP
jgi:hypothetical protein